jgi:hypothetical protein
MFDNLAVVHLDHLEKGTWSAWKGDCLPKEYRALVADVEWLEANGVIFEASIDPRSVKWWPGLGTLQTVFG